MKYMWIQILLSLFAIFAGARVAGRYRVKELSGGMSGFWLVFWLLVLLAVWLPGTATYLANRLGVGRGADLVTYVSLLVLFYLNFRLLVRLEKMERDITKVVHQVALDEAGKSK